MRVTIEKVTHVKNLPASESIIDTVVKEVPLMQTKDDTLEQRCAKKIVDSLDVKKTNGSLIIHDNPHSLWHKDDRDLLNKHPVADTIADIMTQNL